VDAYTSAAFDTRDLGTEEDGTVTAYPVEITVQTTQRKTEARIRCTCSAVGRGFDAMHDRRCRATTKRNPRAYTCCAYPVSSGFLARLSGNVIAIYTLLGPKTVGR